MFSGRGGCGILCAMHIRTWVLGMAFAAAGAGPILAHHAFSSEFDANAPVTLRGPETRVEWINPHAWIHMEHKLANGKVEVWMVEGGTPNTLQRNGVTRDSVKVGHEACDGEDVFVLPCGPVVEDHRRPERRVQLVVGVVLTNVATW